MAIRDSLKGRKPPQGGLSTAPPQGGSGVVPAAPKKLAHRCGHEIKLGNLEQSDCLECKGKKRREKKAREMAKRQAKGAGPNWKEEAEHRAERLPEGSTFHVQYDAAKQQWSGKLTIIDSAFGTLAKEFSGTASGVFRLLSNLDKEYRAWMAGDKP